MNHPNELALSPAPSDASLSPGAESADSESKPEIDFTDAVENISLLPSSRLWSEVARLGAERDAANVKQGELAPHRQRLFLAGDFEGLARHDDAVLVLQQESELCEARRSVVASAAQLAEAREIEEQKIRYWRETEKLIEETAQKIVDAYVVAQRMLCEIAADAKIAMGRRNDAHALRPENQSDQSLRVAEHLAAEKGGWKFIDPLFDEIVLYNVETGRAQPISVFVDEIIKGRDVEEYRLSLPAVPTISCRVLHGTVNGVEPGGEVEVAIDEVDGLVARRIVSRI